ncbi:fat-body protein 1 [Drosophila kikkawai]|uniref:Fat-body protein 1 n=1 Tax=Drosophila kikkawai TaxID=30033 RepID=A0ABM4GH44_DROKI
MNWILLLVACAASAVAAGRISMSPERVQGIERLSLEDLQLQKFILDIVQNIRQPLQQNDLIQLDQGLIVDSQRYRGGIDAEMQRVIDLDRQRRLLDEHEVYTVGRLEDVQQLRGIYRLLVRSQDFDTLRRNVVYLRRNINPVLLVNALVLAIRDRQDTRNLVVPAVQELLPELYLDGDVIEQVRGVQREQTQRPSLMDIIGLRQRQRMNPMMNILMPWREIHMQMALMRQQNRQNILGKNRVVIRAENQGQIEGTSLLTDDIALRNFVQNLIQEMALLEQDSQDSQEDEIRNVLERDQRINREEEDQWIGRNREWNNRERELGQGEDSGRLLSVNRRRQQEDLQGQSQVNQRERFQQILRRDDDNDDDDNDDDDDNIRLGRVQGGLRTGGTRNLLRVNRRRLQEGQREDINQENDDDVRMGRVQLERGNSQGGIRMGGVQELPTVNVNSDRLVHVGRRRMNTIQEDQPWGRQRYMGMMRGDRISEGRRVGQQEDVRQNDWQMTRQRQRLDQNEEEREQGRRVGQEEDVRQNDWQIWRQRQRLDDNKKEREQGRRIVGQQEQGSYADQLESVSRDDERLVHVNRRRLNQDISQQQQQQQRIIPRRVGSIGEGRRVLGERLIQDEDILKLIRGEKRLQLMTDEEILEMLKRNRQQRLEKMQNDNDDDDDNDDEDEVRGTRSRRSISNLRRENTRRSEILLHNLRQLVARLNQEAISQGQMTNQQLPWLNNPRQTQSERYGLRLNQIRVDSMRNREILQQIGEIEQRLQEVIGQVVNRISISSQRGEMEEQRRLESRMADVLLGRLGQVGILNIVRQVVQDNSQQIDRSGLGIRLSDPVVQHTLRRIVRIVDQQREQMLGGYRQEQLQMRGVTINDVRVDKLRTRIEEHDLDLSNLVEQDQQVQQVVVGRQRRLNNKPFTIDMDITSDRDQDAIVRVLLGPAEDQQGRQGVSLEQRRRDFVLLDAINVQLQTGRNRIQQRSVDIPWTTRDVTPLGEIYRRVMLQLGNKGQQELVQDLVGENGGFPQHLLLPRGRPEGLPMQVLVIVSPVLEQQEQEIEPEIDMGIGRASLRDVRPLGYPLDRPIDNEQELLQLPNIQMQDVVIVQEN